MRTHRHLLTAVAAFLIAAAPASTVVQAAVTITTPPDSTVTPIDTSVPTPPTTVPQPANLLVTGSGNGHGVGMSQWGAYGMSSLAAATYSQILSFYYGTSYKLTYATTAEAQTPMTVKLTAFDNQTRFVFVSGSAATPLLTSATGTAAYQTVVVERAPGSYPPVWNVSVSQERSCYPSSLVAAAQNTQTIRVFANGSSLPTTPLVNLPAVCAPDGSVLAYRGELAPRYGTVGELRLVNVVPLELYLRTVVASEMSPSWSKVAASALQAQAVAARSYALAEGFGRKYTAPLGWVLPYRSYARYSFAKTCDTSTCQVYRPAGKRASITSTMQSNEYTATDTAIVSTTGVVLRDTVTLQVLSAMFSASNGGRSVALGKLPSRRDTYDLVAANPWRKWQRTVSATEMAALWPQVGVVTNVSVRSDQYGERALDVTIVGAAGTVTVSADAFRQALKLPSTMYKAELQTPVMKIM